MSKTNYFRRILGLVILIAAVATLTLVIRYFIDSARKEQNKSTRSLSTDISMKTIHFTESRQNEKKWELFAQSGSYDKPNDKTALKDVRFIVERNKKNGPVTVTARQGDYLHTIKNVQLTGNVIAKTVDGITFETPQINYYSDSQTFSTKDRVRLTDAALTVEGIGMDLYVARQQAVVRSQVEATVYPGKRKK